MLWTLYRSRPDFQSHFSSFVNSIHQSLEYFSTRLATWLISSPLLWPVLFRVSTVSCIYAGFSSDKCSICRRITLFETLREKPWECPLMSCWRQVPESSPKLWRTVFQFTFETAPALCGAGGNGLWHHSFDDHRQYPQRPRRPTAAIYTTSMYSTICPKGQSCAWGYEWQLWCDSGILPEFGFYGHFCLC